MTESSPAVSRALLLLAALIEANLFSWSWELGWGLGAVRFRTQERFYRRHHIITRQMMQQGQRPPGWGLFFLGTFYDRHSGHLGYRADSFRLPGPRGLAAYLRRTESLR